MNKLLSALAFIWIFSVSLGHALPASVEQIESARHIIADCQKKITTAQEARQRIEKKAYFTNKRKLTKILDLQIFDEHMDEFKKFLSEEQKIMNATSEKIRDLAMAYSSNCTRFTNGILTMVDFSVGKAVPGDTARYFRLERERIKKKQAIVKMIAIGLNVSKKI